MIFKDILMGFIVIHIIYAFQTYPYFDCYVHNFSTITLFGLYLQIFLSNLGICIEYRMETFV